MPSSLDEKLPCPETSLNSFLKTYKAEFAAGRTKYATGFDLKEYPNAAALTVLDFMSRF